VIFWFICSVTLFNTCSAFFCQKCLI
jgi:hypothetical protein